MGISAAIAEKAISSHGAERTIKHGVVVPGEGSGVSVIEVFKESLEKHLPGLMESRPYPGAGPTLEVPPSPIFCDSASFQKQRHISNGF